MRLRVVGIAWLPLAISCGGGEGSYSLLNKSTESIARVTVTICEQSRTFTDVQPGHSKAGCFVVKADDHYSIQVEFRSGRRLQRNIGYVTSGMNFEDEITVTDSDIELSDTKGVANVFK